MDDDSLIIDADSIRSRKKMQLLDEYIIDNILFTEFLLDGTLNIIAKRIKK